MKRKMLVGLQIENEKWSSFWKDSNIAACLFISISLQSIVQNNNLCRKNPFEKYEFYRNVWNWVSTKKKIC